MKRRRRKKSHFLLRWMLRGILVALIVVVVAGLVWTVSLPDISRLAVENPNQTALMVYREQSGVRGQPIWIPLHEIAEELRHAVIVAEDANFYDHQGIDWQAMWYAQKQNLRERRLYRGGSTITQQLAKNLYLDPSKSILRKIKELLIALRLDHELNKSRLLEIYLNVVEWGHGIYGAESAARHYFNKRAADLTVMEASWLAAILPSPRRYDIQRDSPYVQERAEWIARFVERRLGEGPVNRPSALRTASPPSAQVPVHAGLPSRSSQNNGYSSFYFY